MKRDVRFEKEREDSLQMVLHKYFQQVSLSWMCCCLSFQNYFDIAHEIATYLATPENVNCNLNLCYGGKTI